ncbi:MAG: hypothetical protein K0U98_11290 [Deltaproteobacteria bacterium]|nr:hypothetical protein [Deltaproteobacteria bacterium]
MQPEDRERWLWKLTEEADPASQEDSGRRKDRFLGELLEAYRRDELSEVDQQQVEALLLRDEEARRYLESLAGLADPVVPQDLRQTLLDRFGTAPKKSPGQGRRAQWIAASVAIAALVGFLSISSLFSPRRPPPTYDVGISASTEQRDDPVVASSATAFVGSMVTITAVVRGSAEEDVQVALYRLVDGGLERVPRRDFRYRRDRRGAVLLRSPAEVLVGIEPGVFRLFVAVSRGAELPLQLPLPTVAELEEAEIVRGAIRLHSLTLHLQTSTSPVSD